MLGPLPELKPMARARMGYRCHGWRHLGRSTKRWRSAGIGSCRRTPLGGTRGSSALHAPDGRPEGSGSGIGCPRGYPEDQRPLEN